MQLSLFTVVLASLATVAFAQIRKNCNAMELILEADDPVYMNKRGEIIPASNVERSQYREFVKRQDIDEAIPVKTNQNGMSDYD